MRPFSFGFGVNHRCAHAHAHEYSHMYTHISIEHMLTSYFFFIQFVIVLKFWSFDAWTCDFTIFLGQNPVKGCTIRYKFVYIGQIDVFFLSFIYHCYMPQMPSTRFYHLLRKVVFSTPLNAVLVCQQQLHITFVIIWPLLLPLLFLLMFDKQLKVVHIP